MKHGPLQTNIRILFKIKYVNINVYYFNLCKNQQNGVTVLQWLFTVLINYQKMRKKWNYFNTFYVCDGDCITRIASNYIF